MEDFPTFEEQIQPIAHVHGHVHENQKAVINRISRALGHLEKVKEMVEEGAPDDVIGHSRNEYTRVL